MRAKIPAPLGIGVKLATTFFGTGFLPLVPGTWGSMAGIAVFFILPAGGLWRPAVFAGIAAIGFILCGFAEDVFKKKDPKYVVIDEVAGMMLSLLWLPFYDVKAVFLAFVLFRALDTIKPFPARWIQDRHGSLGIMGDDIAAAVYANLILQAVLRLVS
ncbi:MAG: phosphatidylglycerophosphatase A [Candidatus Omnitrophica bacterium]|jgi:phosphatidylglycerophosphatase A|nr:phosphatidylglycerophosphatase A [Candidatus Omnitrophota bacterium]